ncbi:MAG: thiamine pyrophosphate-dependent enzyme [Actinomycetota bacterium]
MRNTFHKILNHGELPEGRVTTVTIGHHTLAVTHHNGQYGCLDNHCPHQGGPLGEGSIEGGHLRCPWHGYDYNPTTGTPPPPFTDAPPCYHVEVRDDGIYASLPDEEPRPRTVSDVMIGTMTSWGVNTVFGIVGHSNLGLGDAMREAEAAGHLSYIGVRHEGAAAFAASAYGKLTGRPAACFGIAGPGSTNLLTGLYDAKIDRAPVLAISGQVPSATMGRGAFQDLDLSAAFADVARYSQTVLSGSNHAELMTLACKTALVEADVAHLVVPDEVQVQPSDAEAASPAGRTGLRTILPPPDAVDDAVRLIRDSAHPLILVGAGARHDMAAITALAEHLNAPVATTFKAKGQISDHHRLGCGVLGRSGTPIASWFMNESDLILAFGVSFSNHTGVAPYKPIIQVDHDPMALGRFHPVTVPVLGHVGTTATVLHDAVLEDSERPDLRSEVAERWAIWRAEKASRLGDDRGHGLNSARVFAALGTAVDPDAIMAVDVGNNTYSFGRYFEVDRHTVLMSGYLGSIGFGFPAAMGAWAANTGRQVVGVSGDGGFGQYAMEVTTAVKYGMNVTHVLVNNGELGKISKEQRSADLDVWQTSLVNPDFAAFAENCGARGFRVERADQLDAALASALGHDGPALVDIVADASLV